MPIDPVYKKMEVDAILRHLAPDMLVIQKRYADQVSPARIPTVMADKIPISAAKAVRPLRQAAGRQIASLTFTSGTSGQPKAVPNTHANHIWNIRVCSRAWAWTSQDSLLITLPLSHWYGLVMGLSGAIYHGNGLYLRQQSFDAQGIMEDLASGKISLFTHAPIAYMKMLEQPGNYDLSKVRLMISGSAPLAPKLWRDFKDRFGVEILETYGSSETGRIAANRAGKIKLGSPGKVLPRVNLKLSAADEILVKSGGLFPGYWRNPAATRSSKTADGYWRTGDIGELKDGYLFLKGRVQEKIRKHGYTVSPRDVEWAMLNNPKIKEISVIGIQSQTKPDEIYYFVSGNITEEEITSYCKANLPFSWRPDHVIFVADLPRTKNGKLHVKRLKEMAAAG